MQNLTPIGEYLVPVQSVTKSVLSTECYKEMNQTLIPLYDSSGVGYKYLISDFMIICAFMLNLFLFLRFLSVLCLSFNMSALETTTTTNRRKNNTFK